MSGVFLLILTGCPWVGDKLVEQYVPFVDDDGDGVVNGEDCDPANAQVFPGRPEQSWYDGVDDNCDGANDFDQDEDGHAASAYADLQAQTEAEPLPADDCNDLDPLISPDQPDDPYDGLDKNCDGGSEFDVDGDGYNTAWYPDENGVYGDDCFDTDDDADFDNPAGLSAAAVNPGATETWYDGTDADCGGGSDYDQDGDGGDATDYDGLDCDDRDPTIDHDASETPYNGIDEDCTGADLTDQDGDGYDGGDTGTDCDDLDAAAYPFAVESTGDLLDADCDGAPDTVALGSLSLLGGYAWGGPTDLAWAVGDTYIYLTVQTDSVEIPVEGDDPDDYYLGSVALFWPVGALSPLAADHVVLTAESYDQSAGAVSAGFSALQMDGAQYLASRLTFVDGSSNRYGRLQYAKLNTTNGSTDKDFYHSYVQGRDIGADVALAVDDSGVIYAVSCEASSGVMTVVIADFVADAVEEDLEDSSFSACALDGYDGAPRLTTASEMGLTTWEVNADGTLNAQPGRLDYAPTDLDIPADWDERVLVMADSVLDAVVLVDEAGNETLYGQGRSPVQVHAIEGPDGTRYIAYVTEDGAVRLAWEGGSGDYDQEVTAPAENFVASNVSLAWMSDRLIIAVTGSYSDSGAADVALTQLIPG